MINVAEAQLALRNRALGLVVATTGPMSLAATTTGYTRATGSFLTDGFRVGMEATPAGFTANAADVITDVEALRITTAHGRAAQASGAGRSLSVTLPARRFFDNALDAESKREEGYHYLTEEMIPGGGAMVTFPENRGQAAEDGLYVLTWYGLSGVGMLGLRDCVDALRARFTPGTSFAIDSGRVRVRRDRHPVAGQLVPVAGGWTACQLQVPWDSRSRNVVLP